MQTSIAALLPTSRGGAHLYHPLTPMGAAAVSRDGGVARPLPPNGVRVGVYGKAPAL
jgi:hypothetical protein